ncbi:MAG: ECF-type sigma factor [Xanthomonadales bacterium]|nr:ECF-type sigma factor [Xanthomonadales bacterium]
MPTSAPGQVTMLLERVSNGEDDALKTLFSLVYAELRLIARRQLAGHRRSTLSTTAVVHEAFLKFLSGQPISVADRRHFYALAARAMRQILIDHARMHLSQKRGGGDVRSLMENDGAEVDLKAAELLDLDAALDRLGEFDERMCRIVDLRFFAGLSVEETSELMELSPRTVKREWRKARAFLYQQVDSGAAASA